jgi:hypothetical protein
MCTCKETSNKSTPPTNRGSMDLLWEGNPERVPSIEEVVNNNDPAQAWVLCKAPTTHLLPIKCS